jgi:hypothetical protein
MSVFHTLLFNPGTLAEPLIRHINCFAIMQIPSQKWAAVCAGRTRRHPPGGAPIPGEEARTGNIPKSLRNPEYPQVTLTRLIRGMACCIHIDKVIFIL